MLFGDPVLAFFGKLPKLKLSTVVRKKVEVGLTCNNSLSRTRRDSISSRSVMVASGGLMSKT